MKSLKAFCASLFNHQKEDIVESNILEQKLNYVLYNQKQLYKLLSLLNKNLELFNKLLSNRKIHVALSHEASEHTLH